MDGKCEIFSLFHFNISRFCLFSESVYYRDTVVVVEHAGAAEFGHPHARAEVGSAAHSTDEASRVHFFQKSTRESRLGVGGKREKRVLGDTVIPISNAYFEVSD